MANVSVKEFQFLSLKSDRSVLLVYGINGTHFGMSDHLQSVFLYCVLFTKFVEPNISRVFEQLGTISLNDFKYVKEEALASKKR